MRSVLRMAVGGDEGPDEEEEEEDWDGKDSRETR
jgi:hypothetical protein